MKLVKPALDVGFQIAATDPSVMLAHYRDVLGVHFDHDLPLGGGRMQSRHTWGDSVIKLNHQRDAVPQAPATGWAGLTLFGPNVTEPGAGTDPEGNFVTRTPAHSETVEVALAVRDAQASLTFFAALDLPVDGDRIGIGASAIRVQETPAARHAGLEGPGLRYITLQIDQADRAHARALEAGAMEGMAPRTLGTVARISFIVEPGGNWIELSQRASLVGRLDT